MSCWRAACSQPQWMMCRWKVVHGMCDARFDKVADALADAIFSGEGLGAAIAIDIDGESVLDLGGGYADAAQTKQWAETPSSTYGRAPRR